MNLIDAAIFILFIATISVPLALKFRLPLEIFLVIGSCLVSLIPGLPLLQVNPMVVFNIFLPPILFSAAYLTSWRDFRFNLRPILLLALGLVLCTTTAVAIAAKLLLPEFTWAEGFLLGAIVSPSDASAATAIIRKLGAPRRLISILEGESLINDASALLLYRFSLSAILIGTFSIPDAIIQFFIVTVGGAIVGMIVGYIAIRILQFLGDSQAETILTFIAAFASYLLAEHFNTSGVIATVICGCYFSLHFPEISPLETRLTTRSSWGTLLFIINGFAFTLIGLALPATLKALATYGAFDLIMYGISISLVVILIRIFWVYPAAYIPRLLSSKIKHHDPVPSNGFLFAIGWTGMRGIVSLAAVLAVPVYTGPNISFPHRDLMIFLTYCVVVATLIPPSLTLPLLFRLLNLRALDDKLKEEALGRIRSLEGVIQHIALIVEKESIPCQTFHEFKNQIERRIGVIQTQLDDAPYSTLNHDYIAIKKMTIAALEKQRQALLRLRKAGEIHDEVFHHLLYEIDLEEMRARSMRI